MDRRRRNGRLRRKIRRGKIKKWIRIYLFVVYLTTLSVAKIIWRRVSAELGIVWKVVVVACFKV
jgi:ABC-type transport system involved in Fe-S cluster assembly fused permease/ATPase subunit